MPIRYELAKYLKNKDSLRICGTYEYEMNHPSKLETSILLTDVKINSNPVVEIDHLWATISIEDLDALQKKLHLKNKDILIGDGIVQEYIKIDPEFESSYIQDYTIRLINIGNSNIQEPLLKTDKLIVNSIDVKGQRTLIEMLRSLNIDMKSASMLIFNEPLKLDNISKTLINSFQSNQPIKNKTEYNDYIIKIAQTLNINVNNIDWFNQFNHLIQTENGIEQIAPNLNDFENVGSFPSLISILEEKGMTNISKIENDTNLNIENIFDEFKNNYDKKYIPTNLKGQIEKLCNYLDINTHKVNWLNCDLNPTKTKISNKVNSDIKIDSNVEYVLESLNQSKIKSLQNQIEMDSSHFITDCDFLTVQEIAERTNVQPYNINKNTIINFKKSNQYSDFNLLKSISELDTNSLSDTEKKELTIILKHKILELSYDIDKSIDNKIKNMHNSFKLENTLERKPNKLS